MSDMATYDGNGSIADRIADQPPVLRPPRAFRSRNAGMVVLALAVERKET